MRRTLYPADVHVAFEGWQALLRRVELSGTAEGQAGNGCKGRTVKEAELERAIAAELGWEAFDAEKFAKKWSGWRCK